LAPGASLVYSLILRVQYTPRFTQNKITITTLSISPREVTLITA